MIKKTKPLPDTDQEPALDMSSMIDVSFLLLIFFLLTSTLDPKEADLGMVLPTREVGPGLDLQVDPMEIKIQADGSIIVDKTMLDSDLTNRNLPLLDDKLQLYKSSTDLLGSQPLVTVIADDEVAGQRFVDVLNALAKVKIRNVTIAGITNEN